VNKNPDTIEIKTDLLFLLDELMEVATVFINGHSFIGMIRNHEYRFAVKEGNSKLAGSYVGLSCEELLKNLTIKGIKKHTRVLQCTCLSEDCWDLEMDILKTENTITWANFKNYHRPKWNHKKIEPLTFDKEQYNNELIKLKSKNIMVFHQKKHIVDSIFDNKKKATEYLEKLSENMNGEYQLVDCPSFPFYAVEYKYGICFYRTHNQESILAFMNKTEQSITLYEFTHTFENPFPGRDNMGSLMHNHIEYENKKIIN